MLAASLAALDPCAVANAKNLCSLWPDPQPTPVLSFQVQCSIEGDKVLLQLAKPQYQYLCTVARRHKHFPENTKHVPESKNISQNTKHFPESKNTYKSKNISQNPKTHPRIQITFGFWEVFCPYEPRYLCRLCYPKIRGWLRHKY